MTYLFGLIKLLVASAFAIKYRTPGQLKAFVTFLGLGIYMVSLYFIGHLMVSEPFSFTRSILETVRTVFVVSCMTIFFWVIFRIIMAIYLFFNPHALPESRNTQSQYHQGSIPYTGQGVRQNYTTAKEWQSL